MKPNTLYYGDCLEVMQKWDDKSVDLIYLDPPFNSNENYNVTIRRGNGIPAQARAFSDTWKYEEAAKRVERIKKASGNPLNKVITGLHTILGDSSTLAYLSYMGERLVEMRRILKDEGSLYLHCDPTESHYLKILMDAVWHRSNFRNEVIWHYKGAALTAATNVFPRKHDILLFYTKSDRYQFSAPREDTLSETMIKRWGKYLESDGKTVLYKSIKHESAEESRSRKRIQKRYGRAPKDNDIAFIANPSLVRSVWDIPEVRNNPKYRESTGVDTQKPLKLLERIISASSNPEDLVLDPFLGSGTTAVAAHGLNRQWVGIDVSNILIDLARRRLQEAGAQVPTPYGTPHDFIAARHLAEKEPLKFESWAITRIPGLFPNDKQVWDGGVDGYGFLLNAADNHASDKVYAQVTGSRTFNQSHFQKFMNVIRRDAPAIGIYITLDDNSTENARIEVKGFGELVYGSSSYPRVQIWSIRQFFHDPPIMPHLPDMTNPVTGKPFKPGLA